MRARDDAYMNSEFLRFGGICMKRQYIFVDGGRKFR